MLRLLVTFSFILAFASPWIAKAQEAQCGLPVCDVAAQVTELRGKNGDQRGMYAINLKAQYKDNSDTAVLRNLQSLGVALKALSVELKDEDWVVRAANDLINTVILNLAKFSVINDTELVEFYRQLEGQASRYALISHWQGQLPQLEGISELEALAVFGASAREHSIVVGDEDWVARAATTLINDITIKLTNLDPAHEGLYDVKMSEASLALGTLNFDKMAVLDSSSSRNLVVVLLNSKLRVTVYSFSNAEIKGNEITGLFLSNGEIAQRMSFILDRRIGTVRGMIESTKNDTIEFSGQQSFSTRGVFAGRAARVVTPTDILGRMEGEIAGIKGVLVVKSFMPNTYSATFTSVNGSVVLSFQGKFFPKNAVLSLTSGDKIKLVVSLREKDGEVLWIGSSFSTVTGKVNAALFLPDQNSL